MRPRTEYDPADNHVSVNGQAAAGGQRLPRPAFNVHVHARGRIRGHEMEITATVDLKHLPTFADRLTELGFVGPVVPLRFETTADGLPLCPKHRIPMRKREKQGDVWYSHSIKDDDGRTFFCRGYEGGDSTGYHLDGPIDESTA